MTSTKPQVNDPSEAGDILPSPKRKPIFGLGASPVIVIAVVLLLIFILFALSAQWIAPYRANQFNMLERLQPPSIEHLLGTDHLGRDILSRIIHGTRISLLVGMFSVLVACALGIPVGVIAGYSKRLDQLLMRIVDGVMAFPAILLAIALTAALGPTLTNIVLAIGIVNAPKIARLVRSTVLVTKNQSFVEAAQGLGASTNRILLRHVVPNSMSPIIVQATFTFSRAVLAEAALTFLGVGIPPDTPTWGIMLNEAQPYLALAPWVAIFPGVMLVLMVLALNLLGDAWRDALDPRLRNL